jgi:hypothetical protein
LRGTTLDKLKQMGHPLCEQTQGGSDVPKGVIHAKNRRNSTIEIRGRAVAPDDSPELLSLTKYGQRIRHPCQSSRVELARFQEEYEAKYPKAVDCLTKDTDTLFTFMDYTAAHWLHLRTTNAIESTFATVKARTRKTKGAGSRNAGLAMAFKLLTLAEGRWRRVNSPHLVALVAAGVKFPDGKTRILPDLSSDSVVNL